MNLEEFFDSLDLQTIQEFIDIHRQEDLYLEFKSVSSRPFNKDDKKNFAKALSGFANSSGGIVVWGINARKNAGVDSASEQRPIAGLSRFLSDLNSFTGQFVSPVVDGVQHKKIPNGEDIGFAASLIPESESGPHMAKGGENRYYKRSGDSFYVMEHFDLEDMFGRRPHPNLKLTVKVETGAIRGNGLDKEAVVILGLTNIGRGVAKFPYLALNVNPPYKMRYGLDGNGNTGLPHLVQSRETVHRRIFGGSPGIVVYPDAELDVTAVRIRIHKGTPPPDLLIQYSICCDGARMTNGTRHLPGASIEKAMFPKG